MEYSKSIEIRWSDIDPLFHVRHSCYFDFGSFCRLSFMNEHGLTAPLMLEHHVAPIVFREECVFKREILFGDSVIVKLAIDKLSADGRKWTLKNEIWTNGKTLAAELLVEGAWMDTLGRKIVVPPKLFSNSFETIPKTTTFQIV